MENEKLHPIRQFRKDSGLSLDDLAKRIEDLTGARPSVARLSRIETGHQPVSIDLIAPLRTITGMSAEDLRPDLVPTAPQALRQ